MPLVAHYARYTVWVAMAIGVGACSSSTPAADGPGPEPSDSAAQAHASAAAAAAAAAAEPSAVASASATESADEAPPPLPNSGKLITNGDIKKVVRASFDKMKTCFEEGLERDPSLHGRVDVMLAIDDQGGVVSASARPAPKRPKPGDMPTLQDRQVTDCIVSNFRSLRFPHTNRGIMNFVYPVEFSVE